MPSTNIPPVPLSTHETCSFTPTTTISLKPTKTMPLIQSPPRCSSYLPRKPSPLTTYTQCQHVISPFGSLLRRTKRRTLVNPPNVDNHASADAPQHTPTAPATCPSNFSLRPGTPIWRSGDHSWTKTFRVGTDEYQVLKVPPDWNSPYILKNVATGREYDIKFPKEMVEFLFPP